MSLTLTWKKKESRKSEPPFDLFPSSAFNWIERISKSLVNSRMYSDAFPFRQETNGVVLDRLHLPTNQFLIFNIIS